MMKYKILVPEDEFVCKDDGKRLVLFLVDRDDENHIMVYNFYKNYIHEKQGCVRLWTCFRPL